MAYVPFVISEHFADGGELVVTWVLAQNGATVYILGRRKEKLETAAKIHQAVCLLDSRNRMLMVAFERENHPACRWCYFKR